MDLNKAVEHCWDRRDYPEIISDDAGLDISIPRFITRGPWREHNRPRRITLNVTTYIGTSWNAVHYYGNLDIEGISFSNEGKKERRRKRRAYGSQGWGGEIYFKRFGEIMIDCVNKRKARQLIKKQIREELRNEL